eukprot:2221651-Alexandrium_andersonii.AAC.1
MCIRDRLLLDVHALHSSPVKVQDTPWNGKGSGAHGAVTETQEVRTTSAQGLAPLRKGDSPAAGEGAKSL